MSLEKLFVSFWKDWSEDETGVITLVDPTFTPAFAKWIASRGYVFPDREHYVILTHGFNRESPVVVEVSTDTGPVWDYSMTLWDFACFVRETC